ncbi:MAG: LysM peptidoglycan-binding domain-containing protein [Waddliaceae bacterium]|jgi:peptidoglycan DL-endopeptidase LytF|nr:LysM peptidoglycan-binding domain-containing protein [Waddliaceae bacterium]MBT3579451.1 LysM peptidoglycan-binding domain-containing protein [Waddliaceae bacterium]MBT4444989.1 LysM peptidoglycan-binding domain-containing protein [Waddliaceae bacterium]MBT6928950.1 LysM peptidoglycan-binding domain-containing protein [Waddliaceae bacterium]MBT7264464.1 LysM peptidoglycan-binding domain-containing protein [Waddliaceae bacterium]
MSRRDVILFAVVINVGLLILLFATAKNTGEQEISMSKDPIPQVEEMLTKVSNDKGTERHIVVDDVDKALDAIAIADTIAPTTPKEANTADADGEKYVSITVKTGDYLDRVARMNGTTVDEIINLNGLKSTELKIGQVLKVPVAKEEPVKANDNETSDDYDTVDYYIVRSGDNPWLIAMRHKMPLNELLELNDLDESSARRLKPGDKLLVK